MADTYKYDDENIFAKILRGEIPNTTVLETDHSLAFRDIYPQAPEHVLVIPKGAYVCYDHFAAEASADEIVDYTRAIGAVCSMLGVTPGGGKGTGRSNGNIRCKKCHISMFISSPADPLGQCSPASIDLKVRARRTMILFPFRPRSPGALPLTPAYLDRKEDVGVPGPRARAPQWSSHASRGE